MLAQTSWLHVSSGDIEVYARAVVFSYNNAPHSFGVSVRHTLSISGNYLNASSSRSEFSHGEFHPLKVENGLEGHGFLNDFMDFISLYEMQNSTMAFQ